MFANANRTFATAVALVLAVWAPVANAGPHYKVAHFPGTMIGLAYTGPAACGQADPPARYSGFVRILKSRIAKTGIIKYHFLRNGTSGPQQQQLAPPSPGLFVRFRMTDVPHTAIEPNVWEQLVLDAPAAANWLVVEESPHVNPICQNIQ